MSDFILLAMTSPSYAIASEGKPVPIATIANPNEAISLCALLSIYTRGIASSPCGLLAKVLIEGDIASESEATSRVGCLSSRGDRHVAALLAMAKSAKSL
jgi:hypothetical protein